MNMFASLACRAKMCVAVLWGTHSYVSVHGAYHTPLLDPAESYSASRYGPDCEGDQRLAPVTGCGQCLQRHPKWGIAGAAAGLVLVAHGVIPHFLSPSDHDHVTSTSTSTGPLTTLTSTEFLNRSAQYDKTTDEFTDSRVTGTTPFLGLGHNKNDSHTNDTTSPLSTSAQVDGTSVEPNKTKDMTSAAPGDNESSLHDENQGVLTSTDPLLGGTSSKTTAAVSKLKDDSFNAERNGTSREPVSAPVFVQHKSTATSKGPVAHTTDLETHHETSPEDGGSKSTPSNGVLLHTQSTTEGEAIVKQEERSSSTPNGNQLFKSTPSEGALLHTKSTTEEGEAIVKQEERSSSTPNGNQLSKSTTSEKAFLPKKSTTEGEANPTPENGISSTLNGGQPSQKDARSSGTTRKSITERVTEAAARLGDTSNSQGSQQNLLTTEGVSEVDNALTGTHTTLESVSGSETPPTSTFWLSRTVTSALSPVTSAFSRLLRGAKESSSSTYPEGQEN